MSNHAARRAALRSLLTAADADAEALLVTDLLNIRYLTGFTGSNAALLVARDRRRPEHLLHRRPLRHPGRRPGAGPAHGHRPGVGRGPGPGRHRPARLRGAHLTVADHTRLAALGTAELVPTAGLVEELRAVKDADEIEALRRACEIADTAFAALIADGGIRAGRTEREVGLDLDERMRRGGAEDPAFETIVAAGAHSAIPHHRPTGVGAAAR